MANTWNDKQQKFAKGQTNKKWKVAKIEINKKWKMAKIENNKKWNMAKIENNKKWKICSSKAALARCWRASAEFWIIIFSLFFILKLL